MEIIPTKPLGGLDAVFNTSPDSARELFKRGREDARKVLAEAGMERSAGG